MLTFLINLYCPKPYHRPAHSIRIVLKPVIFTETRTQNTCWVCDLSSCNLLTETNNSVLCAVLISCLISELQKNFSSGFEPRTVFRGCGLCSCGLTETNNFGIGRFLYRTEFPRYRKHPNWVSNPGHFLRSFDLTKISSWFQGISIPSLVQIGVSVLEL
jgi:hypothetical protein